MGFDWNIFDEYETYFDDRNENYNDDISKLKMRIVGYYDFPNQRMNPESEKIEEAAKLAPLLEYSVNSLVENEEVGNRLKRVIKGPAVIIFEDQNKNLYAYYTINSIVRITNVVYDSKCIKLVRSKYQSWFIPGEIINVIDKNAFGADGISITSESLIKELNNLLNDISNILPTNAKIVSFNNDEIKILTDSGEEIILNSKRFIGLNQNNKSDRIFVTKKRNSYYVNAFVQKEQLVNFFVEHIQDVPNVKPLITNWNDQIKIFLKTLRKGLINTYLVADYYDFITNLHRFKKDVLSKDKIIKESQTVIDQDSSVSISELKQEINLLFNNLTDINPTNATIEKVEFTDIEESIIVNKNNSLGIKNIRSGDRVLVAKKSKTYYINALKTKSELLGCIIKHFSYIPSDNEKRKYWNKRMHVIFNLISKGFSENISAEEFKKFRRNVLAYKRSVINNAGNENDDEDNEL